MEIEFIPVWRGQETDISIYKKLAEFGLYSVLRDVFCDGWQYNFLLMRSESLSH